MADKEEDTWETQEVIDWLINNEGYWHILYGTDPDYIREFITVEKDGPEGLYESFVRHTGNFNLVDWKVVAQALEWEEEEK